MAFTDSNEIHAEWLMLFVWECNRVSLKTEIIFPSFDFTDQNPDQYVLLRELFHV